MSNRHRYYAPKLGRYLQPDPIGFVGGDANLYTYVMNNPLGSIDPRGLATIMGMMCPGPSGKARPYVKHALDRLAEMAERGITKDLVEEAIANGVTSAGSKPDRTIYDLSAAISSIGRALRVVVDDITGAVITVIDKGSKR